jgi:hypothetical protein
VTASGRKASGSFFEKKEPKKLLFICWGEVRQFEALGGVRGEAVLITTLRYGGVAELCG